MDLTTFFIVYYIEMFVNVILLMMNLMVSIFLCREFRKTKSMFKTPYFYILNSFYMVEMVFCVCWVYGRTRNYALEDPFLSVVLTVQWYCYCLTGIWEAVLGLTRCTVLAFPKVHKMVRHFAKTSSSGFYDFDSE